jgi:hypothetical protein
VKSVGSSLKNSGSFSEVWKGDAFAEFRQAHLDGRPPQICRTCYEQDEQ